MPLNTFQKFLTRSAAYLAFPFEISHLLSIQSNKLKYIFFISKLMHHQYGEKDLFHKFCAILESHKSYFCNYLCFGIICQYSICLCWLLGVKLRHPLLSFSHTKRTFGSQRIVWCLFFANRIVDYTSICTLFSFVFLCSWVLWPLCRRQTIILASLPLYISFPYHPNLFVYSFIYLCHYYLY